MKSISYLCTAIFLAISVSACSMHRNNGEAFEYTKDKKVKTVPSDLSQDDMMKKWQEAATPNSNHEKLRALEGNWDYSSRFWMKADDKPEASKGTSIHRFILGGRYLEEHIKGTALGQPFEGRGFIGYDNVSKQYNSIFMDNMSTGLMVAKGSFSESRKTIEEHATVSCPMANGPIAVRGLWTIVGRDQLKYETFMLDQNGKEYRSMEIVYNRRK